MQGSEVSEVDDVDAAVAGLRAAVDGLLTLDLTRLSSVQVVGVLEAVEVERRRFEPVDQAVLAEVVTRGIAGEYGRTSPVDLLVDRLKLLPAEAKARLVRAGELGPRHELTGLALDPILPETSAAVADGSISARHADVIITAVAAIPDDLEADYGRIVEHALVEQSRLAHPGQVAKAAQVLLDRIDPDGQAPQDEEHERRREFGLRTNPDGTVTPFGRLTPETGALWRPILDTLGRPEPGQDGTPDPRTAGQRGHDAFRDAGTRLLRSDLPAHGGSPVTLLVMMAIDDFVTGTGTAVTSHGDRVSVREILKQAADAQIIPVHLSDTGGIVSYGRTRRDATCPQRRALTARDRGCSFPGCTRPPAWCQAHHVVSWADGGPTDLDNLTLLCGFHHRNFEALGWSCHMHDGIPLWTPPAWLDPDRQPRRNTAHHLEIDFDTG